MILIINIKGKADSSIKSLKQKIKFSREKSIVQTEPALINVISAMISLNHCFSRFSFISKIISSETEV